MMLPSAKRSVMQVLYHSRLAKMYYYRWMSRLQLYILGAFVVVVVVSTVAFVMLRTSPTKTLSTWEGAGGFLPVGERSSLNEPGDPGYRGSGVDSLGTVPLPSTEGMPTASFDELATLLGELVRPATTTRTSEETFTPSAYAFIPQGFLNTETEKPRTPEQRALHEYGNALGIALQSFADLHTNMVQVLKDQAEDRSDAVKAEGVKRLGDDFVRLGTEIGNMDEVPASMQDAHEKLAAAYQDVGTKLAAIPGAADDEALLAAVNTYNASAEELSRRLVDMIDRFVGSGVTFSASDPGAVFTFSAQSSF
jgi:hypothetical protein